MASVNKIIVVGNVGRDAEFRVSQSGTSILNFSVATTEKYKDKEDTQWHNVVIFGKLAEAIKDFVTKGRQIYVEGQMKYSKYEKDGVTKTKSDIVVGMGGTVMLLGKGDAQRKTTTVETTSGPVDVNDDVPF